MRIAWCTPFSTRSAIGSVSALAVEQLALIPGVSVDVWQPRASRGRTWSGVTRTLNPRRPEELRDYDRVVYHLGDHAANHLDIWEASEAAPGVVVMHDLTYYGLFHTRLRERGQYARVMTRWYGPDSVPPGPASGGSEGADGWAVLGAAYPLRELAAANATAVVVHSEYAARAIADSTLADVHVVGLPVDDLGGGTQSRAQLGLPESVPVVLQGGVLNANKLPEVVIEAVASLRGAAHLVIAGMGPPSAVEHLSGVVRQHQAEDVVTLLPNASDDVMASLRHHASVGTVLRSPCLEGASYALLENLAAGLPCVCSDDGSYREFPDSFVRRVPLPPRAEHVAAEVSGLLARSGPNIGLDAQDYIRANHTQRGYALDMLAILEADSGVGPRASLASLLGQRIRRVGFGSDSELAERAAERAAWLFGHRPSG